MILATQFHVIIMVFPDTLSKRCTICDKFLPRKYQINRWLSGYMNTRLCKKCYWKTRDGYPPNARLDLTTIADTDREALASHDSTTEGLKLRNRNNCKLFRCLVCWKYIFPDDSITLYEAGYAHKLCLEIR